MGGSSHKKDKKDKKRKRDDTQSQDSRKLLTQATLGDKRACKRLLKSSGIDVNTCDADLNTPLHHACRHGHLDVIKTLLKYGASTEAQNLHGDTPAHLAVRNYHLDALSLLLESKHPPSLDIANDKGWTVSQMTDAAIEKQEHQATKRRKEHEVAYKAAQHNMYDNDDDEFYMNAADDNDHVDDYIQGPANEIDHEYWYRKLEDELANEENIPGVYYDDTWHADEYETPEEYAQRIWEEMNARNRAKQRAEEAKAEDHRRSESARKEWARKQAEENSRKILEEQKAADAAWRAEVASGSAGSKRAAYEAAWEFFCVKNTQKPASFQDIPWIIRSMSLHNKKAVDTEELKRVVLFGANSVSEKKQRLRMELMRWHPDKFAAKFGRRLLDKDKAVILDKVKEISQALNEMYTSSTL